MGMRDSRQMPDSLKSPFPIPQSRWSCMLRSRLATMPKQLDIHLLGALEVLSDGAVVPLPASRKSRALLAYLVATGRSHFRDLRILGSRRREGARVLSLGRGQLRAMLDGRCLLARRADRQLLVRLPVVQLSVPTEVPWRDQNSTLTLDLSRNFGQTPQSLSRDSGLLTDRSCSRSADTLPRWFSTFLNTSGWSRRSKCFETSESPRSRSAPGKACQTVKLKQNCGGD